MIHMHGSHRRRIVFRLRHPARTGCGGLLAVRATGPLVAVHQLFLMSPLSKGEPSLDGGLGVIGEFEDEGL
jgi:hypothetical protein